MPNVSCKICSREFYAKPYWLRDGFGKYCSQQCKFEGQKKGKFIDCDICTKKTWKMPKQLKHSKSGKFFCSKSCQTLWRNKVYSGEKHPFWRGGIRIYRNKFIQALLQNGIVPVCSSCKYNNEEVLIVHHKDRNRKNNKSENLELLCRNCHYLEHKGNTI